MTEDERRLLLSTAADVRELFSNRDDMLIGLTAALLDVYRFLIDGGADKKEDVLFRLRAQCAELEGEIKKTGKTSGTLALNWLIANLETGHLDAAKLFRDQVSGTA